VRARGEHFRDASRLQTMSNESGRRSKPRTSGPNNDRVIIMVMYRNAVNYACLQAPSTRKSTKLAVQLRKHRDSE
jgi:hypothetical protein